ncbi:MAG: hypothetical protein ACYC11_00165 [Bellilinea sp.]
MKKNVLLISAIVLAMVVIWGLVSSAKSGSAAISSTPQSTSAPTIIETKIPIRVPSATPTVLGAPEVGLEAGKIPAGAMVKRSACLEGYAQVEYNNPDHPNSWKVEFVKCSP